MGKPRLTKRLTATTSQHEKAPKSIDIKARKRIEELYELTDEIINAYNEINEKYVHHIYEKYQRLKERHRRLQQEINETRHCQGCQCQVRHDNDAASDSSSALEEPQRPATLSSSIMNSARKRPKKTNPFVISDIEDTQTSDANEYRFHRRPSDDEDDRLSNGKMSVQSKIFTDADQSDQENGDEVDEANENGALPLILKTIIERKATKNNNAKSYLLEISKYAGLCDFLLDRSRTSFDHRPTDDILRPFLVTQFGPNVAKDTKLRVRIRDELREIHRSYLRTFMHDPHGLNKSATKPKKNANLSMKKSPL